jgi:hypothetical protein
MKDQVTATGSRAASLKSAQSEDFISENLPTAENSSADGEFNAAGGGGTQVLLQAFTTLPADGGTEGRPSTALPLASSGSETAAGALSGTEGRNATQRVSYSG